MRMGMSTYRHSSATFRVFLVTYELSIYQMYRRKPFGLYNDPVTQAKTRLVFGPNARVNQ